jgi:hypothetical protein
MKSLDSTTRDICRRTFLGRGLAGLGAIALNTLSDGRLLGAAQAPAAVSPLHHPAKAKRIIYLYQAGGPSHLETFDYKPKLAAMNGEPMPESFTRGQQLAQLQRQKLICFCSAVLFQEIR